MSARRMVLDALPRAAPGPRETPPQNARAAPGQPAVSTPSGDTCRATPGSDDLVARFCAEALAVGATVSGPLPEDAATAEALARLRSWGVRHAMGWTRPGGLSRAVLAAASAAGIHLVTAGVTAGAHGRAEALARAREAEVGVTDALGALADTGSLVVAGGPGRSRLAWLLPPSHLAMVSRHRIYATLADFLAAHEGDARVAAHMAVITGPSRTADIELTLTRGVHGPKQVHIVVLA